jgi:trehalose utilization protein
LDEPGQGLPSAVLDQTDVLVWWGHAAHAAVADDLVTRIQERVLAGMGLVVLHSGHESKIFRRLMGTSCLLCWREAGERERVWLVNPGHPIAAGIGDYIELEQSEMYGEPFAVPNPDEVIFISWYEGGEVFRGGCTWTRGSGRIFYFSPGHETYPIYHHPDIQRVIANGIQWARPQGRPANVPRHVPVEQARQKITAKGASVHDEAGRLARHKS